MRTTRSRPRLDEAVLLSEYQTYLTSELGRSPKTLRSYSQGLKRAQRILDGKPLADLTVEDLRRIKREDSLAPATRRAVLTACKSFHEWGALEGHWELRPLHAVKGLKKEKNASPGLSIQQARVLLGSCQIPNEFRVVWLGLYAGCRIAESARMGPDNVRGDRLVFVGKGDKERTVPLHNALRSKLPTIFSTTATDGVLQMNLQRLRKRVRAVDEAGKPVTSHALRRTFAVSLYERFRVPREVVATLLGHDDSVTALYAPVRFHIMREAIDRLDYYGDVRHSNRRMIAEILENGGIRWSSSELRVPLGVSI